MLFAGTKFEPFVRTRLQPLPAYPGRLSLQDYLMEKTFYKQEPEPSCRASLKQ
jgi:hypothetical protein